jgi:putative membrane protein
MTSSTNKTLRPLEVEIPSTADTSRIEPGLLSPKSWRGGAPLPPTRMHTAESAEIDYFAGPRDMNKHSKWPFFLRMHGSVLPKMLLPLVVIALWSTLITLISEFVYPLKISSLLLTILGFVVGLAISFRTSTAYERYAEGRKYWSQMLFVSQNLARTIWIHAAERDGEIGKDDLLAKL